MAAAQLREQAGEAYNRCRQVVGSLNTARQLLHGHGGDAAAGSDQIRHALEGLREASGQLASAMFLVGACRELALRAVPFLPSLPRLSVPAVANLHKAWARAQDAYVTVDQCRDRLVVALFLLAHRSPLAVDILIKDNHAVASRALDYAIELAVACMELARAAYDEVSEDMD